MESKRLTPTIVGKIASKRFIIVVVVVHRDGLELRGGQDLMGNVKGAQLRNFKNPCITATDMATQFHNS